MIKTICVVDDEEGIREAMHAWLEECGYGVIGTGSGADAFEMIRKNKPDLVLLDIMMPKVDGLEVLARLKESPETCLIPVIMLTAKKEIAAIAKATELHAAGYFTKPFEEKAFLAAVERFIRNSF